MRIRSLYVLIAVTATLLVSTRPSAHATGWHGESSRLGGTGRYDHGEWIWQDFIYDDYGADTEVVGASQRVALAPTTGDFRYPTADAYGGNTADINEVRARIDGEDLLMRVKMNTLIDPATTVIGVAIDQFVPAPDGWPHGAGITSEGGTWATVAEGKVWLEGHFAPDEPSESIIDTVANTIEFKLPGAVGHAINGEWIGLTVAAGLWDDTHDEWLAGTSGNSPTAAKYSTGGSTTSRVFDLAFNNNDAEPEGGNWREDLQARALASGDVRGGNFNQRLILDKMRSEVTDPPIAKAGFYDRIFESRQELGEGVHGGFPQYKSRHQTYGLWIPQGYDPTAPAPLVLVLHSLSVHHNQYAGTRMYRQLGDELNAIAITPLARGPDGWYWNEALIDTLEAWSDVKAHYAVDDDRTYSTGYSMGGYGTYRLSALMPDRFAGAVSWVGPPAYQIWPWPLDPIGSSNRQVSGNTYHMLENTEYVPFLIVHGTNDELVPTEGVFHQSERFHELGYEYRYNLHPGIDHFALVVLDDWSRSRDWLSGREMVRDPAHVIFKVRPDAWADGAHEATILDELESVGADLDSAYWVRDIVASGDATVDLTSHGIAARYAQVVEILGVAAGPPSPYLERGLDYDILEAAFGDVLEGTLTGVTEATIDLERAGLTPNTAVRVASDRPATLHLRHSDFARDVRVG